MITHQGTKAIRTERLLLRAFTPDDAGDMYANWASDENVTKFVTWDAHKSPDETSAILEDWCEAYENESVYNWAIELDSHAIGNIAVVRMSDRNAFAELGYCLGSRFWGRGYMTEAVRAVIDFMFSEVGVHRVMICHASKNPASGRVAVKCGLTLEGVRREHTLAKSGEFDDVVEYGILHCEWQK